jgi:hypothetical protein
MQSGLNQSDSAPSTTTQTGLAADRGNGLGPGIEGDAAHNAAIKAPVSELDKQSLKNEAQAIQNARVESVPAPGAEPKATSKSFLSPSLAIMSIVLGVLLMALAIVQARRRQRGSSTGPGVGPAEERSAARVGTSFAANVTQQAVAELATQVKKLSHQLRAANERIEELEKNKEVERQRAKHDAKASQQNANSASVPLPKTSLDVKPGPMNVVANANPVHQQVYALADSGLNPVQIAQAAGLPTGQVELILNLRKALGLAQK